MPKQFLNGKCRLFYHKILLAYCACFYYHTNEALLERGVGGLSQDSIALAHQIRTVSKQRLKESPGFINDSNIQESINGALGVHLNL